MPVSTKIEICINFQASFFSISKISLSFLFTARYLNKFLTVPPRDSLGYSDNRAHWRVAYKNVVTHALFKKVESPDGSTAVETSVEIGGCNIAFEDFCCKHRHMSCCRVQAKVYLIDDILDYMRLQELDFSIL